MGIFLPLGLILPFVILLGMAGFMCNYASFPKIKQIMIDPYYKEVDAMNGGENMAASQK